MIGFVAAVLCVPGLVTGPPHYLTETPEGLRNAHPRWIESMRHSLEQEMELLIEAYELDENMIERLREEVYSLWVEEFEYEQANYAMLDELMEEVAKAGVGEDLESPQWKAFDRAFDEVFRSMPADPENLALALEGLLGPRDFTEARWRLDELRTRQRLRYAATREDHVQKAIAGRQMRRAREARTAVLSPKGKPVPSHRLRARHQHVNVLSEEARQQRMDRRRLDRQRARRRPGDGAVRRRPASEGVLAQTEPVRSPCVDVILGRIDGTPWTSDRCLWTWLRYVGEVVDYQTLSDERRARLREVLEMFRRRLERYRATRADAYTRLEELTDRKLYEERLAELDAPSAALFEELKLRVADVCKEQR